jgi:hypothetical protein
MASRGSALSRALTYFENEPDLNVVRIAFARAKEIVESRLNATAQAKMSKLPFKKRVRQANKAAAAQVRADAGNETLGNA